jgi:hypothetical protein
MQFDSKKKELSSILALDLQAGFLHVAPPASGGNRRRKRYVKFLLFQWMKFVKMRVPFFELFC